MKVGGKKKHHTLRKIKTSAFFAFAPFSGWCCLTLEICKRTWFKFTTKLTQRPARHYHIVLPANSVCLPLGCQVLKIVQWEQSSSLSLTAYKSEPWLGQRMGKAAKLLFKASLVPRAETFLFSQKLGWSHKTSFSQETSDYLSESVNLLGSRVSHWRYLTTWTSRSPTIPARHLAKTKLDLAGEAAFPRKIFFSSCVLYKMQLAEAFFSYFLDSNWGTWKQNLYHDVNLQLILKEYEIFLVLELKAFGCR